jgi:hypothetical protein
MRRWRCKDERIKDGRWHRLGEMWWKWRDEEQEWWSIKSQYRAVKSGDGFVKELAKSWNLNLR